MQGENYKVVAVILNYKTWQDTVECVDSLLNMNYSNHEIIIVDNGSGNESLDELMNYYGNRQSVHVIATDINLGFARGNNLGIKMAVKELNADFVYVANSDTINTTNELYKQVINNYFPGVGVISPTVQKADGSYHLPAINTDDVEKSMKEAIINSLYSYFFFNRMVRNNNKQVVMNKPFEIAEKELILKQYVLHGCAYFLTPDFFRLYDGLFPGTFLYWEELDLLLLMQKADLKTKLVKTDIVIHKVNSSTNLFFRDKEKNRCKMSLESGLKSLPLRRKSLGEIREIINND